MINGFTGLGQNELVGALSRSKHGQSPPNRSTQPMPKLDTVQFSAQSQELSATTVGASQTVERPHVAERPMATEKPAQPAAELSMMDRLKASFFTQAGDEGFDAGADLNSDGRVNNADLAVLREQETPMDPNEMFKRMQSSVFTRTGEDGFDSALDMNTDGVINFADMAMLRARMDAATTRPPPEPVTPAAPIRPEKPDPVVQLNPATPNPLVGDRPDPTVTVDTVRNAMFSRAGDDAFNAAADLNGDGRVNFADLATLRS